MKRFVLILVLVSVVCLLAGCSDSLEYKNPYNYLTEFVHVGYADGPLGQQKIFANKDTKVEYLYCTGHWKEAITVLVDDDGKPLVYEGEFPGENDPKEILMSFKKVGDSKGPMGVESIYVDTKYRVEYLYVSGHKTAGITVLLDRDAKPTIYNGEEFDVN